MQGGGTIPNIEVRAVQTPRQATDVMLENGTSFAIRVLTPLECWRLQGFTDEQFHKAKSNGISDRQLYKQAGNAVTVPVVYQIAKRLQIDE